MFQKNMKDPKNINILHHDIISADIYDQVVRPAWDQAFEKVTIKKWIAQLKENDIQTILEFGCGTGESAINLARKGYKVVALDISMGMLRKARTKANISKLENIFYIQADAEFLPFKEDSFDALTCSWVLHHVPNVEKAINEACRVLSKKGFIFIAEISTNVGLLEKLLKASINSFFEFIHIITARKFDKLKWYRQIPTWERAIDPKIIFNNLDSFGFSYDISYYPYIPFFNYYIEPQKSQKIIEISKRIATILGYDKGTILIISGKKNCLQ